MLDQRSKWFHLVSPGCGRSQALSQELRYQLPDPRVVEPSVTATVHRVERDWNGGLLQRGFEQGALTVRHELNPDSGTRRALFIVIHDPSVAEAATSQWTPSGACSR
jgi:hypothetical protein